MALYWAVGPTRATLPAPPTAMGGNLVNLVDGTTGDAIVIQTPTAAPTNPASGNGQAAPAAGGISIYIYIGIGAAVLIAGFLYCRRSSAAPAAAEKSGAAAGSGDVVNPYAALPVAPASAPAAAAAPASPSAPRKAAAVVRPRDPDSFSQMRAASPARSSSSRTGRKKEREVSLPRLV
jgi:hypothetical protein